MSTMQTYQWEQEILADFAVYPGHPIVTAAMIMDRYHDLAHAEHRVEGRDYGNALSDGFIPGAGCAVRSALRVLETGLGQGGVEAAKAVAVQYWDAWEHQHESNKASAALGRMQAELVLPHFVALLESWKVGRPLPSAYRLAQPVAAPA